MIRVVKKNNSLSLLDKELFLKSKDGCYILKKIDNESYCLQQLFIIYFKEIICEFYKNWMDKQFEIYQDEFTVFEKLRYMVSEKIGWGEYSLETFLVDNEGKNHTLKIKVFKKKSWSCFKNSRRSFGELGRRLNGFTIEKKIKPSLDEYIKKFKSMMRSGEVNNSLKLSPSAIQERKKKFGYEEGMELQV